jgi:hypothetical protein
MKSTDSKVVASSVAAAAGVITLGGSILQLTGVKLETDLLLKIAVALVSAVVAFILGRRFGRTGGGSDS